MRTVIKHVTTRLKRHWRRTRIVWRGDSHYGRVEAMEWAESNDADYIFGLAGSWLRRSAPDRPSGAERRTLANWPSEVRNVSVLVATFAPS